LIPRTGTVMIPNSEHSGIVMDKNTQPHAPVSAAVTEYWKAKWERADAMLEGASTSPVQPQAPQRAA
jgi:hypothetical protein